MLWPDAIRVHDRVVISSANSLVALIYNGLHNFGFGRHL